MKKLPKRSQQHILETASIKLFASKIPDSWIIREMTERDYGIDCYLEFANNENELTGKHVLIQLKGKSSIPWTKKDYYTIRGIKISTSNYWNNFKVPVFIFLADINKKEMYFVSVNHFINGNYKLYSQQKTFNYVVEKKNNFGNIENQMYFRFLFEYASLRQKFESELILFFSSHTNYQNFISKPKDDNYFKKIDESDLFFIESMYNNYRFLCSYCNVDLKMLSFQNIQNDIIMKNKVAYPHERNKSIFTEIKKILSSNRDKLIMNIKDILESEIEYWIDKNPTLINLLDIIK